MAFHEIAWVLCIFFWNFLLALIPSSWTFLKQIVDLSMKPIIPILQLSDFFSFFRLWFHCHLLVLQYNVWSKNILMGGYGKCQIYLWNVYIAYICQMLCWQKHLSYNQDRFADWHAESIIPLYHDQQRGGFFFWITLYSQTSFDCITSISLGCLLHYVFVFFITFLFKYFSTGMVFIVFLISL